jgi:hypothetical protein
VKNCIFGWYSIIILIKLIHVIGFFFSLKKRMTRGKKTEEGRSNGACIEQLVWPALPEKIQKGKIERERERAYPSSAVVVLRLCTVAVGSKVFSACGLAAYGGS